MPDPDPDFSPCDAVLHAEPAGELRQPTAEEVAQLQSEIDATPTAGAQTAVPEPIATPRPIDGQTAEEIMLNAGCGNCHKIGSLGEAHKVGPDLTYIGLTAPDRVPGMSGEEYILQSILDPNAYLAPECPNTSCLPNIMPQNFHMRLTTEQLEMLVDYLMGQQGPEPTPVPVGSGLSVTASPKAVGAGKVVAPTPPSNLPSTTVGVFIILLVAAVSAFLIFRDRSES